MLSDKIGIPAVHANGPGTKTGDSRQGSPPAVETEHQDKRGQTQTTFERDESSDTRNSPHAPNNLKTPNTHKKPNLIDRFQRRDRPVVIAHRGNHEHTETDNDIPALRRSARDGSDAVEMDIRRLGDGTKVIFHDPEVTPNILGFDVPIELDRIGWQDFHRFAPNAPKLSQWSKHAGRLGVNVVAEFKESGYEAEAMKVLLRHIPRGKLTAMSFESDAVNAIQRSYPNIPVGILSDSQHEGYGLRRQLHRLNEQPDFVAMRDGDAGRRMLHRLDTRGVDSWVWTVNDAGHAEELLDSPSIDGIITDIPTTVVSERNGR